MIRSILLNLFNFSELKKRPLVCGFFIFIGGIIYAYYTKAHFLALLYATVLIALSIFALRKKTSNASFILLSLLIFVSGALSYIHFNTLPANDIYNVLENPSQHLYINGIVKSLPSYTWQRWGNRKCRFILGVSACKIDGVWLKATGLSQVTITDNDKEYNYGDNVLLYGEIEKITTRELNTHGYINYLHRRGIYTAIKAKNDTDIMCIGKVRPGMLKRYIHRLRREVERRFKRYLPYPDDVILSAMLVGRRDAIPRNLSQLFINTGTMHILSVSGLHVGIISGIIFFFFGKLKVPRKVLSLITIIFLWIYVIMAGERAPVIRASIMISVFLFSVILERDFDIYSALSFAGLLILLINPMQVFDAGFQLSFSCVFFIVFLTPRIENIFSGNKLYERGAVLRGFIKNMLFYISRLFFASLAVFIGIWPIVAFHFKIISPVTIIANIIVIPFLGIILSLACVLACIPDIFLFLITIISGIIHSIFCLIFHITGFISGLPLAYFNIKRFPLWALLLYYFFLYIVVSLPLGHNMQGIKVKKG
jgi:competence protein ComEC